MAVLSNATEIAVARTLVVDPKGGGTHLSVRAALSAVADADTILIEDGIYDEAPGEQQLRQLKITLRSRTRDPNTVRLRGVQIYFSACHGTTIEGVTFEDTYSPIISAYSAMVVDNCRFVANRSNTYGAAFASGSNGPNDAPTIRNCVFIGNRCENQDGASGGAVAGNRIHLSNCLFVDNWAALRGGALLADGDSVVEDCVFFRNRAGQGAAVYFNGENLFQRCTFLDNRSQRGGCVTMFAGSSTWKNCIFAGAENDVAFDCFVNPQTVECCRFYGYLESTEGNWCFDVHVNGNFSADPRFCDPAIGDVGLSEGSPCLPGLHNDRECELIGAAGAGCGILMPVEEASWGGIKARFSPKSFFRLGAAPTR